MGYLFLIGTTRFSKDRIIICGTQQLQYFSCGISNAYLEAPHGEKLWTVARKEFVSLDGIPMQSNRAFYGLKSAGNSWHKALSTTLSKMNFEPSRADLDI